MEVDPNDLEVVNSARRRQLLDEFDRAERAISALTAQVALLTKARSDVVEQLRKLEVGD